jgi:hypothetical protein
MVEIEFGQIAGHVRGISQPGKFVARGEGGNGAGLRHHRPHRLWSQVGAAGRALGAVEIHGDSQRPVALVFNGFNLAEANGDVQALLKAHVGLRLGSTRRLRLLQGKSHDIAKFRDSGCVDGL